MNILKELEKYIKSNLELFSTLSREEVSRKCFCADLECAPSAPSINNYINTNKDDNLFQTLLYRFIDRTNLSDADIYNKVNIDRRLFSKIRNYEYHPGRDTVILLGLALKLNEDEIEDFLKSASYSLPKNNKRDLIIRFCFLNHIYDLFKVNEFLSEYDCKLLNN